MCYRTTRCARDRCKNGTPKAAFLCEHNYKRAMTHDNDKCTRPPQEQRNNVRALTATAAANSIIVTAPGRAGICPPNIATGAEPGTETNTRTPTHSDKRVYPPYERRSNLRTPPPALQAAVAAASRRPGGEQTITPHREGRGPKKSLAHDDAVPRRAAKSSEHCIVPPHKHTTKSPLADNLLALRANPPSEGGDGSASSSGHGRGAPRKGDLSAPTATKSQAASC